jgi:hypothetical protein
VLSDHSRHGRDEGLSQPTSTLKRASISSTGQVTKSVMVVHRHRQGIFRTNGATAAAC